MNAEKALLNNCKICKCETRPLQDPKLKLTFHICTACGYTFKDASAYVSKAVEKTVYDKHQNSMENLGYVDMFNRFLSAAVLPFVKTGKALDFGSGPGPVLFELLKQNGFESDHYDLYYHPDKSVFNKQYDLITSTEVFEHLKDPLVTLELLVEQLKPGGILALMTNFKTMNDEVFLNWWYIRDETHIGFFTLESFKALTKKYPLSIIYTNHKNYVTFKKIKE